MENDSKPTVVFTQRREEIFYYRQPKKALARARKLHET
jgi:hypothetical protein